MKRYLVFRQIHGGSLLESEDVEPRFVFIPEEDVKTGLYVLGSNPLLTHDPDTIVEAENPTAAKERYLSERHNVFM